MVVYSYRSSIAGTVKMAMAMAILSCILHGTYSYTLFLALSRRLRLRLRLYPIDLAYNHGKTVRVIN